MTAGAPAGAAAGTGRARPRRRRLAFAAIAVALVWLLLEVGGIAAWWLGTGSVFTWGRAAAARDLARAGDLAAPDADPATAAAQQLVTAGSAQHPYLGFVYDADRANFGAAISRFGFVDDAPPLRRRGEDRFVVGIVGGSVALQLAYYADGALRAALARSPAIGGKTVELVRLAIGGYKQPQQLLTVELLLALGGEFDCIVNLDGYNEVALLDENLPHGVPAWYPRSWARLMDRAPSADQLLRLGRLAALRAERAERVAAADSFWWSPLAQYVWWWRDRASVADLGALRAEIERAAVAPSFALTGPGTGGVAAEQARAEMVAVWGRASRQLHAACTARGIRYVHFLQPNQYVAGSKPIGAEEAAVALARDDARGHAVAAGYPLLQAEGRALAAAGVPFVDLTGVFRDHPEPLYVDTCCHLGPAGNRILAEHVAAGIRRQVDLAGVELRSLVVEPARLELDSPFARSWLRVTGVDERGGRHDVGGAGFGVRYACEPAGLLAIAADGTLRATAPGSGTLRLALGAASAAVPFTAAWAERIEGDDGRAGDDGVVPRLRVEPVAGGGGALRVQCEALPRAPFRLLVAGPRPLPDSPVRADTSDLHVVPLAGDAVAPLQVELPPLPGPLVFVRVYGLAADATAVVAASPTIVVTRR